MSPHRTRPALLALAILVVGAQTACDRVPTQPDEGIRASGTPLLTVAPAPIPTVLGPWQVPIAPTNTFGEGELGWTLTGIKLPSFTAYVVKVQGRVTVSSNPAVVQCFPDHLPPYGAEGSYGPMGTGAYNQLLVTTSFATASYWDNVPLYGASPGRDGGSDVASDTLFAWNDGEVAVFRKGILHGISGGVNNCPGIGFYAFSSGQSITVTKLDGQELHISPKQVLVRKGQVVRFTATTSDGTVIDTPNWRFIPASSAVPNETGDCGIQGPNPCDLKLNNDGEYRVSRYVNWRMRGDGATVRIYHSFALTADKGVINAGDTANFTPLIDEAPGGALHWRWRADDKTEDADPCSVIVDHACRYAPASSGTMWAYSTDDSAMAYVSVTSVGGGSCGGASARKSSVLPAASTKLAPSGTTTRDCSDDGSAPASVVIDEAPNGGGYPVSRMLPSETIDIGDKFYSTMNFRVRVLDGHGAVVPNADVHLTLEVAELSGGHDHEAPDLPRSAGSFGDGPGGPVVLDLNTGGTGQVVFTYQSPDQSGSVTLLAKTGTVSGFQKVLVEFPGLVPLSPIPGYLELVGTDEYHKERYWVDREEMQQLQYMAIALVKEFADDDMCAGCTRHLGVNDASLPFGGQFDVHGNWRKPHADHRQGQGADIRITDKSEDQIKFMRDYWELDMDGHVYDESQPGTNPSSTGPHYHFMRCKGECNH